MTPAPAQHGGRMEGRSPRLRGRRAIRASRGPLPTAPTRGQHDPGAATTTRWAQSCTRSLHALGMLGAGWAGKVQHVHLHPAIRRRRRHEVARPHCRHRDSCAPDLTQAMQPDLSQRKRGVGARICQARRVLVSQDSSVQYESAGPGSAQTGSPQPHSPCTWPAKRVVQGAAESSAPQQ